MSLSIHKKLSSLKMHGGWLFILIFLFPFASAVDWAVRGLNTNVEWLTYTEAITKQKEMRFPKPICVLFTGPRDQTSTELKRQLRESEDFVEISKEFLMVNIENEAEEPKRNFMPDGSYVPRMLFLDKEAKLVLDQVNKNEKEWHKYFYRTVSDVITSMKWARINIEHDYRLRQIKDEL
eukprot:TRINITY_DN3285_c0_g2_i1.p1 TRINITY_DN3285_c0_g2~~TRINITY_DN3285_c0_g2_i1.p1  ORF type:complete len:179 (-),score=20.92 TRINITY_DN3285_c0_g2_i1:53-589(-)